MTDNALSSGERVTGALELVEAALSGAASTLNLALVAGALRESVNAQNGAISIGAELSILKDDLVARIRGMQGAIIVATDAMDSAPDTSEDLLALKAAELIKRYRVTCGRFRDTFPGNLSYVGQQSRRRFQRDWSEFRGGSG
ncbi:MAG: hypothetical protein ACE5GA_06015 [Candidatus Zixiibacteriota bacterium]